MSRRPHLQAPAPTRLLWPVLSILLLVAVMVALVWWRVLRPPQQAPVAKAEATPARPRGPTPDLKRMGEQQLLAAARQAMQAQRLVAPAGDNAVAYYLQVLQRDPGNPAAREALRELFPFAAQAAEQTVGSGDPEQAQRELDLLARVDPTNYTLTLLRAKLAERRQLATGDAATAHPASRRRSPQPTPVAPVTAFAAPLSTPPAVVSHLPPPPVAVAAPRKAPAAPLRVPPLLLRQVPPYYPADARSQHRQGWVEVRYVVGRDGRVHDARVVRARPRHLFDHAAVSAVEHWQFRPGRLGDKPVATTVTSRVDFRLPR